MAHVPPTSHHTICCAVLCPQASLALLSSTVGSVLRRCGGYLTAQQDGTIVAAFNDPSHAIM